MSIEKDAAVSPTGVSWGKPEASRGGGTFLGLSSHWADSQGTGVMGPEAEEWPQWPRGESRECVEQGAISPHVEGDPAGIAVQGDGHPLEGLGELEVRPGVGQGLAALLVQLQHPDSMLWGLGNPAFSIQALYTHAQHPGLPVAHLHLPVIPPSQEALLAQDAGLLLEPPRAGVRSHENSSHHTLLPSSDRLSLGLVVSRSSFRLTVERRGSCVWGLGCLPCRWGTPRLISHTGTSPAISGNHFTVSVSCARSCPNSVSLRDQDTCSLGLGMGAWQKAPGRRECGQCAGSLGHFPGCVPCCFHKLVLVGRVCMRARWRQRETQ